MELARDVCRQLVGEGNELDLWRQHKHDLDQYIHHACKLQADSKGLQCWGCASQSVVVQMLQTRSADEGMTAFLVCLACKRRKQVS